MDIPSASGRRLHTLIARLDERSDDRRREGHLSEELLSEWARDSER
jgi:hypothetical protein